MFTFREQLRKSKRLDVCGYSFRDVHINHIILSWLVGDNLRRMVVHDPVLDRDGVLENMAQNIPSTQRRFPLSGGLVEVVQEGAAEWLARVQE
jgi:hypothetical protein